jgi:hypothetical protein
LISLLRRRELLRRGVDNARTLPRTLAHASRITPHHRRTNARHYHASRVSAHASYFRLFDISLFLRLPGAIFSAFF